MPYKPNIKKLKTTIFKRLWQCHSLLLLLMFSLSPKSYGQEYYKYNLNGDNGLPSNHVYSIMKDRNGYLWFATPKGIARYNGYEFKTFGLIDGLPKQDIWQLFEDKPGRIWLGTISEEMGYIRNYKYHHATLKNITHSIYPTNIRSLGNGLIFFTPFLTGNSRNSICIAENDTITRYDIPDSLYKNSYPEYPVYQRPFELVFIDERGKAKIHL